VQGVSSTCFRSVLSVMSVTFALRRPPPAVRRNRKQSEFNETTIPFSYLLLVFFRQLFGSSLRHVRHRGVSTAARVEKANQRWRCHLYYTERAKRYIRHDHALRQWRKFWQCEK